MAKNKRNELLILAQQRKEARWPGYNCISDYNDGAYECDFVSPYTQSSNNVDSGIFILLQDWSSDKSLSGPLDDDVKKYGLTPGLPTNRRLRELLLYAFW